MMLENRKENTVCIPKSKQVAIIANMTALALLGNYALVAIPNVELGTVIIFIASLVFGTYYGIWTALLSSMLFASFNPWGPFIPQIWIAQLIGWVYVAIVGGEIRPTEFFKFQGRRKLVAIGAILALVFDLITNIGYSIVSGIPYHLTIMLGLPFTVVHVFSTAIIMGLVVPPVERILKRDLGPMIWEGVEESAR